MENLEQVLTLETLPKAFTQLTVEVSTGMKIEFGQPLSAFDFAFRPDLSKLIMVSIARNSPCPCGSGKKYKRCCMDNPQPTAAMIHRIFEEAGQRQDEEATLIFDISTANTFRYDTILYKIALVYGQNS